MSSTLLGDSFDIHGGGRDLIFPHHENEIAQSEGASGKPFVRYWLHNGFVNVNQEKMSKSLGNFFTIREILARYNPEVVRFFILTAHYRSPIDFADQQLDEAGHALTRCYEALDQAGRLLPLAVPSGAGAVPVALQDAVARLAELEGRFREAMDDDFNTAQAIGHLFDGVRALNRLLAAGEATGTPGVRAAIVAGHASLLRLGGVLGLFASVPADWLAAQGQRRLAGSGLDEAAIAALIAERQAARSNRDFARADQIRDHLAAQGIELLDSKDGTSWKAK
jgi:cysteinyl-tRNA synthetase